MATATVIAGRIKYPAGQAKDYGYGERINILVAPDDSSDDIRVYDKPGSLIASLKKGQPVTLIHDGKPYKVATDNSNKETPKQTAEERRTEMQFYISAQARLYKACYQSALQELAEFELDDAAIRAIATTIHISTQKKFGL